MELVGKLRARLISGEAFRRPFDEVIFLCPHCRRHEASVRFHRQGAGEVRGIRILQGSPSDPARPLETLTIRHTVDARNSNYCGGWSGCITEGHVH
jgi:hypothetical protein